MKFSHRLHVGRVRNHQEDGVFVDVKRGVFAVLDGMGGSHSGQTAVSFIKHALAQKITDEPEGHDLFLGSRRDLFEEAVAYMAFREEEAGGNAYKGHGATCSMLAFQGEWALVNHVGDTRAYLWRQGQIHRLTKDQTLLQDYIDQGFLSTQEELDAFPYKNVLVSALLVTKDRTVNAQLSMQRAHIGDRFLLCSDGVHEHVSDEVLEDLLGEAESVEHASELVLAAVLETEARDNIAVMVVELEEGDLNSSFHQPVDATEQEIFGRVRAELHEQTEQSWYRAMFLVEQLRHDDTLPPEVLETTLNYILGQAKQWPPAVPRDVPLFWIGQLLEQALPLKFLRLCDRLRVPDGLWAEDAEFIRMLELIRYANLELALGARTLSHSFVLQCVEPHRVFSPGAQRELLRCISEQLLMKLLEDETLSTFGRGLLEDEWGRRVLLKSQEVHP